MREVNYTEFLKQKIVLATNSGFEVDRDNLNPALKPHQKDAVSWALKGGKRALFESFGLGKTIQEIEFCYQVIKHEGGKALIVLPLGVKQEFTHDAVEILHYDKPRYITCMKEVEAIKGIEFSNDDDKHISAKIGWGYDTETSDGKQYKQPPFEVTTKYDKANNRNYTNYAIYDMTLIQKNNRVEEVTEPTLTEEKPAPIAQEQEPSPFNMLSGTVGLDFLNVPDNFGTELPFR